MIAMIWEYDWSKLASAFKYEFSDIIINFIWKSFKYELQDTWRLQKRRYSTFHLEDKNKDKKKTTDSYTGGESSGMAVINPDVQGIMQKAEKNSK